MTDRRVPVDRLAPIGVLAEEMGIPLNTMRRWSDVGRNNNFPKPVENIGPVRFYDREEVERWVALWRMTGHPGKMGKSNGQRG